MRKVGKKIGWYFPSYFFVRGKGNGELRNKRIRKIYIDNCCKWLYNKILMINA
jgi:hypothetical protein